LVLISWGRETAELEGKGAHLSKDEAGVWVLDARDTPIGVDADVRLFFELVEFLEDSVVG
jgi:hypothetical protein